MELTLTALEKRIDTFQVEKQQIFQQLTEIPVKIRETEEELQKRENLLKSYQILKQKFNENGLRITKEISKIRKCRYYNRGYCKFQEECNFAHPSTICQDLLKNGKCYLRQCPDRHPKICRYWQREEGCRRSQYCTYLHQQNQVHRNPVQATENEDSANQPINVESDSGFSFPCPLCRNEFTSEESLREHTNATHDKIAQLNCNDCDFNTDNENILQTHIEEVHTFQCNMCNYSAKTKGWLTRHINTSHQTISRIDSYDEPHQPELTDNSRIDATKNVH